MADPVLALEWIHSKVKERFEVLFMDVEQPFGWRQPTQQISKARITWAPGDPNGALGEIAAPRSIGDNPRNRGTLHELCTVEISAFDVSDVANELAQYRATRLLFDAWYAAVARCAHGLFSIKSDKWIVKRKEMPRGAAIQVVFSVSAIIPDDEEAGIKTAPTTGEVESELLDNTETMTITGVEPYEPPDEPEEED